MLLKAAELIHSVDSLELVEEINQSCRKTWESSKYFVGSENI